MHTISIIMPVYNSDRFLSQAIESILSQTYHNFEFLIVDDGSTDQSYEIVKQYARDSRIKHWQLPNAGVVQRLNNLLDRAANPLIARMDADDIALPHRLEKQVEFLTNHPDHVAVGSQIEVIDDEGTTLDLWCNQQTHEAIDAVLINPLNTGLTVVCHPAVMYRRDAVLAVGKYRQEVQYAEDLDLFLRLVDNGGKLANLPETLLKYRLHLGGVCHRHFEKMWNSGQIAVREARHRRRLPELPVAPPDESKLIGNVTSA
jgi:glycosyltransferase involved in cell wall biosynthesis